MADLLNSKQCYYSRGNTDCSEWDYSRCSQQLDFCENCDRYSQCHDVAVLNDRLKELDGIGTCRHCGEDYNITDLKKSNIGLLCDTCIRAIKSRGESITIEVN